MTTARKNAIIFYDIMRADRQQKPARVKPFKAVLRLAKLQWCINIPLTAEKPATSKIQAHKRHIIGTEYTPEPIPGKPPRSLKCYGIVNRLVPRFEIRGSPILHEKKIGGFCGLYIRPPAGVPKSFNFENIGEKNSKKFRNRRIINMDKIREFVKEVYSRTDDLISPETLEEEVSATMEKIKNGDWTAIYSEVSDALIEYDNKREFWIGMLNKLVGFQRYGVQ